MRMPVASPLTKDSPLLDNLAKLERRVGVGVASHLNIEPVFDIFANMQDRDLGGFPRISVQLSMNFKVK